MGPEFRRFAFAAVAVIAIVLLVLSLFIGWYALDYRTTCGEAPGRGAVNETFYPGVAVHGTRGEGVGTTYTTWNVSDYSGQGLNATGRLYAAAGIAIPISAALAAAGTGLFLKGDVGGRSRRRTRFVLLLVGGLLSLSVPLAILLLQPGAIHQDWFQSWNAPSPGSSFIGSFQGASGPCLVNGNWGPGPGWYLGLCGGVLLLLGTLMALWNARRTPPRVSPP